MAEVVLGLGVSHSPFLSVPAELWPAYAERDKRNPWLFRVPDGAHISYEELLGSADPALAKQLTPEVFQARHEANQRGIAWASRALVEARADVVVIFGDDQEEVFDRQFMPAIGIFSQPEVEFSQRDLKPDDPVDASILATYGGRGPHRYLLHGPLATHLIVSLTSQGFDVMHVGAVAEGRVMSHAFGFVWRRVMNGTRVPTVPVHVNTYFPPNQPTPERCLALGRAVRSAIEAWDDASSGPRQALRVAVIGSGGLSHFVVDEELDQRALDVMRRKSEEGIRQLPLKRMQSGTSEIRNWIAVAGACEHLDMELFDYVPCYRTPAGTGCAMGFARWT